MTTMERLREHYQDVLKLFPEEQIFALCLQGSQNYDMADEESDVDTKCIVLPSLDDIIFNKEAKSYTYIRENDEHIDIKDIRLMFKQYRKQNINFVETLFSKYVIVNPAYQKYWDELYKHRELIAHYSIKQAMSTMCGMCHEKYHALCHEYPSRMYYIENYGFDGKQLSHLIRVYEFMLMYSLKIPYEKCLIPKDRDYLLQVKRHQLGMTKEEAQHLALEYLEKADKLKAIYSDKFYQDNPKVQKACDKILDGVQKEIMCEFLKSSLQN